MFLLLFAIRYDDSLNKFKIDKRSLGLMDQKNRFWFGENWRNYSKKIDETSIQESVLSLKNILNDLDINGLSFLDIGSGSGLSSLAALRMGANIVAFDYDINSSQVTKAVLDQFSLKETSYKIKTGSILDRDFTNSLGTFDVVYSWGVLHHTGAMWLAIENTIALVKEGGHLALALYNDQGVRSHFWWIVKYINSRFPKPLVVLNSYLIHFFVQIALVVKYSIMFRFKTVFSILFERPKRGMRRSNDIIDWYAGCPYEFVNFETFVEYMRLRGFNLIRSNKAQSAENHEFLFKKTTNK